jgi:hypothetical protein
MSAAEGKYTIELCVEGGPGAGIEGVIASDDDLTKARALYRRAVARLLADRARILARSDQADTMPEWQPPLESKPSE